MPPSGHFRFPRESRIVTAAEFGRIKRGGRRVATRYFLVYLAPAAAGIPRLGMIVTRKVGGAVHRNRCKRVLREAFRLSRHNFPAPVDLVVIVKRSEDSPTLERYTKDLELALATRSRTNRDGL
jgi:ribonuclease P protein component